MAFGPIGKHRRWSAEVSNEFSENIKTELGCAVPLGHTSMNQANTLFPLSRFSAGGHGTMAKVEKKKFAAR